MRHVAYPTSNGQDLAMAVSATTAEDTWFSGHKTRLGFGGGIYDSGGGSGGGSSSSSSSNNNNIVDIVGGGCGIASTATKLERHGAQIRDAINANRSDAEDAGSDDEQTICDRDASGESYKRRLLLSAFSSAATVVPVHHTAADLPSSKWPPLFRRKKSHLLKHKQRLGLSYVDEIGEPGAVASDSGGSGDDTNVAVFSDNTDRRGDAAKTRLNCGDRGCVSASDTRASLTNVRGRDVAVAGGGDSNDNDDEFAGDTTGLISDLDAGDTDGDGAPLDDARLLGSASDLRESVSRGDTETNGGAAATKSRQRRKSWSWYGEASEKLHQLNGAIFADTSGSCGAGDVHEWRRRGTFTSVPEDEDAIGEIGVDSEERVVLLERSRSRCRSASVPDDDALSTPPAKRTTKTTTTATVIDDVHNSVPLLSQRSSPPPPRTATVRTRTRTTSGAAPSGSKLGKWSKSKIDLLVPGLKSLVTMTTNKLSASRPANLNYWRNGGCTANHNYSASRFDVRALGLPLAATLRRNISLNNVTSGSGSGSDATSVAYDGLKKASSGDISQIGLLNKKLRKCNTVLTLSGCVSRNVTSASGNVHVEPLHPVNRLRRCSSNSQDTLPTSRMCSRCSSLLSMASTSRYSLNSAYGFVPVSTSGVLCKVCLNEVPLKDSWTLQHCECSFCVDCVRSYVEFEINQGAYSISCPDAQCEKQGIIQLEEIESLVSLENIVKHKRYRLNREVEMDKSRTWCPRAGCETVCTVCSKNRSKPECVHCPTCSMDFCSNCRAAWHGETLCKPEEAVPGVTFDSELIKCCPMCSVPIEKDEGCAQMLCKRCKHVFCWYCLASLDEDFLLRHYDKGPCKNKLGHSRASIIWHRTQVVSIFVSFGILLLIASPLLLLAAPCIVCCKCHVCTTMDSNTDDDLPEAAYLQPNNDTSTDKETHNSSENLKP